MRGIIKIIVPRIHRYLFSRIHPLKGRAQLIPRKFFFLDQKEFMFSTRSPSSGEVRSCALEVRMGNWPTFVFDGHNATKNKKYTP